MIAKWLWHLEILDVTGLNPALHENVFWTDFAKISHSASDPIAPHWKDKFGTRSVGSLTMTLKVVMFNGEIDDAPSKEDSTDTKVDHNKLEE